MAQKCKVEQVAGVTETTEASGKVALSASRMTRSNTNSSGSEFVELPASWKTPMKNNREKIVEPKNTGPMERKKALLDDIPAVIRVAEMAKNMNDREFKYLSEIENLKRENETWEARVLELQNNFDNYKERHKIEAGLVEELEAKTHMLMSEVENLQREKEIWEARELELKNNFNNYKERNKIEVGLVEELETKTQTLLSEMENLRRENKTWEAQELELQNNFDNYKKRHKIQVGMVKELEVKTQTLESLMIERNSLLEEVKNLEAEKSKVEDALKVTEEIAGKVEGLEKRKVELEENISLLKSNDGSSNDGPYAGFSRQDLINRIEELNVDVLSFLTSTF